MNKINNRIEWIDGLKAFAIFLIVLGHAINGDSAVWHWAYGFHVPLFIVISGMTNHIKEETLKDYAKKKFIHIMIPYFIWGIISIVIYQLIGARFDGEQALPLSKSIFGLLWANGETGIMRWNLPLWFLPSFFVLSIFAYFLEKCHKTVKSILCLLVGEVLLALLIYHSHFITNLPYSIETSIYLLPFFSYGKLLSIFIKNKKEEHNKIIILPCLIGITLSSYLILYQKNVDYVSDQYRIYILFLLTAVVMITSLIGIFTMIKHYPKYILDIGQNTLSIMILQKFPLIFFEKVCPIVKNYYVTNKVATSFTITIFTILMCMIVKKIIDKYIPWMLNPKTSKV